MRTLVAVLLVLATPLCAQAGNHWRDSRGAPPPAYQGGGGGRPMYAPGPHGFHGAPPPYAGPPPYAAPTRPPYAGRPPYAAPGAPVGPGPVYAAPPFRTQQQRAREEMRSGRRVPLPSVIERLRRTTGAEYMDMREGVDPSGRPVYVLRFRQHGRIFDVPVDAETGVVQR